MQSCGDNLRVAGTGKNQNILHKILISKIPRNHEKQKLEIMPIWPLWEEKWSSDLHSL